MHPLSCFRIAARVSERIKELSKMPATMAEDVRIQAMIELRALRLINFQRQVFQLSAGCTVLSQTYSALLALYIEWAFVKCHSKQLC